MDWPAFVKYSYLKCKEIIYILWRCALEKSNSYLWLTLAVSIHQAQQNKVKGSVGRSAMLPCYSHFLEEYDTSFRWLKNNSSLMAGIIGKSKISVLDESFRNRIQMPANSSTGNLSLMITHLRVEDLGMYQCEASSKNQSIRYEKIFLYVTEGKVTMIQIKPFKKFSIYILFYLAEANV